MLVSLKWLANYIDLPADHAELAHRLSMAGLNHESTETIDGNVVIDLEITSNRGDCLGHIGVAREIGVLYDRPVHAKEPVLSCSRVPIHSLLKVENQFVEACPRYTARVIQGVKVGKSPDWLIEALQSVFWKRRTDGTVERYQSINNVVDATNYVLMECGQPLHAFDFAKVAGGTIVVRPGRKGETLQAIDHREYELDEAMCVIADAKEASAIAGVMGGAKSEVSDATTDLVIEAAIFTPLSVRRTARKLKLQSPSSYRFERKVDPVGIDWSSKRVCEIIVDLAGGSVADGVIDTAPDVPNREPIVLRASQLERILGIRLDTTTIIRILSALGCRPLSADAPIKVPSQPSDAVAFVPPSWRHDLTREADLIEEVARVHGYDKIPEDAPIPVAPSSKRPFDAAMDRIRQILTACGLSEAMTPSIVTQRLDESLSPWTDRPALETQTPMLKGARRLRRTLIPSLLEGRAKNWAAASIAADLFEIAHVYLPSDHEQTLPIEQYSLAVVCGRDFFALKGILETLCARLGIEQALQVESAMRAGFAPGRCVELRLDNSLLGYLGSIDAKVLKSWKLPPEVTVAEVSLGCLLDKSQLVPQQRSVSMFPSIQRDLNFVVAESVQWRDLDRVVRSAVGTELAELTYRETYRDPNKDGRDRKRVLMTVELQRHDTTLSGSQADELVHRVIEACRNQLSAELLAS